MGNRKLKIRRYVDNEEIIFSIKDDKSEAKKVQKGQKTFSQLANSRGLVAQEAKQLSLFDYSADGRVRLNPDKIKDAAQQIKKETLSARFYPEEYNQKEISELAEKHGISYRKARNIITREYQIKATAILTSAEASKTKIDPHTKGILNKYASGQYEEAIYGKVDKTTGKRRYEQGRYFSELGFAEAERKRKKGRRSTATTEADRDAKRREFLQEVATTRTGSGDGTLRAFASGDKKQVDYKKQYQAVVEADRIFEQRQRQAEADYKERKRQRMDLERLSKPANYDDIPF